MSARKPSPRHLEQLVADLSADDAVRRETAVARLSLLGTQAAEPLAAVAGSGASATARVAALQALELIGAAQVVEPAAACLKDDDPVVAHAALEVMGRLVRSDQEERSLGEITAVALDTSRRGPLRIQALEVLAGLPRGIVEPIWRRLGGDPDPAVRAHVTRPPAVLPRLADVTAFTSIATPAAARELISAQSASAPLAALHRLMDHLRASEQAESRSARRAEWTAARGALHQALAARGSRVALYDLRETIEAAKGPLPGAFPAALAAIGDESCLDALAAAWARSGKPLRDEDFRWRDQVRGAFREIVRRRRLSARHPALRKVAAHWPGAAADLLGGARRGRQ